VKQLADKQEKNTINNSKSIGSKSLWLGIFVTCIVMLFCICLQNALGIVTRQIAGVILGIFGIVSYPLFLGLGLFSFFKMRNRTVSISRPKIALLVCALISAIFVIHTITTFEAFDLEFKDYAKYTFEMSYSMGGVVIGTPVYGLASLISPVGTIIFFGFATAMFIWFFSGKTSKDIIKRFRSKTKHSVQNHNVPNEFEKGLNVYSSQVIPQMDHSLYVGKIEPTISSSKSLSGDIYQMQSNQELNIFGTLEGLLPPIQGQEDESVNIVSNGTGFVPYDFSNLNGDNQRVLSAEEQRRQSSRLFIENKEKSEREFANSTNFNIASRFSQKDNMIPPTITATDFGYSNGSVVNNGYTLPPKFVHNDDSAPTPLSTITNPATIKSDIEYFNEGEIINADLVASSINNSGKVLKADENSDQFVDFSKSSTVPNNTVSNNLQKLFNSNSALNLTLPPNLNATINGELFGVNELKENSIFKQESVESQVPKKTKYVKPAMDTINTKRTRFDANDDIISGIDDANDVESDSFNSSDNSFEKLIAQENFKKDRDFLSKNLAGVVDSDFESNIGDDTDSNFVPNNIDYLDSLEDPIITPINPIMPFDDFSSIGLQRSKSNRVSQTKMDDILTEPIKKTSLRKKRKYYEFPPISLLANLSTDVETNNEHIAKNGELLVEALKKFGLPVNLFNTVVGPAVTRYELSMDSGVAVKKVEKYTSDIEYELACKGHIRIEIPIPGKKAIGVEVPNDTIATVGLKSILQSKVFIEAKSPLTVALGKDISGEFVVANLAKMPHLLIAGATGSGKSACLNSIITSLVYKSRPDDVRLILIDPKRVEFNIYSELPNLLLRSIINEPEHAINAFDWAIGEMERRYNLFQSFMSLNVKTLEDYNNMDSVINGEVPKLPYIVIIVDELADLMMSNKKVVEEKIRALSAKSRAAGIHLVLATQRPSVDVLTGTIKNNLPSRIAFAVTSYNDSKTIFDTSGAENLLGRGDMLFLSTDSNVMRRIQGAYITNDEVATVVNFCKTNNEAIYDEAIENSIMRKKVQSEGFSVAGYRDPNATDPLFEDALHYAISKGQISVSKVQSLFEVGYARALRIISQMEKRGYISEGDGAKPRNILLSMDEFVKLYPDAHSKNKGHY